MFPEVAYGSGRPYVNWQVVPRPIMSDADCNCGELWLEPADDERIISAGTQCSKLVCGPR